MTVLAVFLFSSLRAHAVDVDGLATSREWHGGRSAVLVESGGSTNCELDYIYVSTLVDDETNSLYVLFECRSKNDIADSYRLGAEVYLDGDVVYACRDEKLNRFDENLYSLGSAFSVSEVVRQFICEMRIGIKFGIPDRLEIGLRAYDETGAPSDYYTFTVREPQEKSAETEKTSKETTAKKEKTTAEKKTTEKKETTTKETTEKQTAEKRTEPKTDNKITASAAASSAVSPFTTVKYAPQDIKAAAPSTTAVTETKSAETSSVKETKRKTKEKEKKKTETSETEKTTLSKKAETSSDKIFLTERISENKSAVETTVSAAETELILPESEKGVISMTASGKRAAGIGISSALLASAIAVTAVLGAGKIKKTSKNSEVFKSDKENDEGE
ncbi:MAG: hypothetical protein K6F09_02060 [Clostridiales bacterium]|nr:hypothetical protein [Clostridiales bacterium]